MSEASTPAVSVLMPAYNASEYLRDSIDSVLNQTFADFEFIIIDDGSCDDTAAIVQSYSDRRIRFFRQPNQGLAATLNRAIELSTGSLLARQDADDVAYPERFARQKQFMDDHPEIALVGTAAEIWVEDKPSIRFHRHPCDPAELALRMLFDNYFVHSSVMIRRKVFDTVGKYSSEKARQPEDFELWSRVSRQFSMANLPEVLEIYRERAGSICRTDHFEHKCIAIAAENIACTLGRPQPLEIDRHLASLMRGQRPEGEKISLTELEAVLNELICRLGNRFDITDPLNWPPAIQRRDSLRHQYDRFYGRWRLARILRSRLGKAREALRSLSR
jgi:glycosyltransferase involved in cell wall biosynthesis